MRKIAAQINELNNKWVKFSKENHYNKPHVYSKDNFSSTGPLATRAMKLKLVREAVDLWRKRYNRDTMLYEDDLSFLVGKYEDARERRLDYDRYFVLATRYGQYEEKEFYKDSRPGHRYWRRVLVAALKFQRAWDRYWAVQKIRRYRAARSTYITFQIPLFCYNITSFVLNSLAKIIIDEYKLPGG
jgi:hypothetical protein